MTAADDQARPAGPAVRLEPMTPQRYLSWIPETIAGFAAQRSESTTQSEQRARAEAERAFDRLLPDGLHTDGHHLWSVFEAEGTGEVGYLWLAVAEPTGRGEAFVYDVAVAATARGRGLGRAVMLAAEEEARGRGATVIKLNVFAHNQPARALYDSLGYQVAATQMARRLDLSAMPVPTRPRVRLEPMTEAEFDRYRARAEQAYAESFVASGTLPAAEARTRAADDFARLLPEGLATPGQHLWTALDADREVGMIWLAVSRTPDGLHAFGYDLLVPEPLRRHGYGRAIMALAERECRDRGVVRVGLNVFGHNAGAHSLYEQAGFEATSALMTKRLR